MLLVSKLNYRGIILNFLLNPAYLLPYFNKRLCCVANNVHTHSVEVQVSEQLLWWCT